MRIQQNTRQHTHPDAKKGAGLLTIASSLRPLQREQGQSQTQSHLHIEWKGEHEDILGDKYIESAAQQQANNGGLPPKHATHQEEGSPRDECSHQSRHHHGYLLMESKNQCRAIQQSFFHRSMPHISGPHKCADTPEIRQLAAMHKNLHGVFAKQGIRFGGIKI